MATKRTGVADVVKNDMEKRFGTGEKIPEVDNMIQLNFRMKQSEYNRLMLVLNDEGKLFSQGVRSIIRDYLKRKGAI